MTYRSPTSSTGRWRKTEFISVSEISLNSAGWATEVLWCEANAKSDDEVVAPVVVPVAEVLDAIHDGVHMATILLPLHTLCRNAPLRSFSREMAFVGHLSQSVSTAKG
jgi:hypothetical protein